MFCHAFHYFVKIIYKFTQWNFGYHFLIRIYRPIIDNFFYMIVRKIKLIKVYNYLLLF